MKLNMTKMKHKIVLGGSALIGLMFVGLAIWINGSRNSLDQVLMIPAGYYAKELCTCRYVLGLPKTYCETNEEQIIPLSGHQFSDPKREVTIELFSKKARARWRNSESGCRLEEISS